MAGIADPKQPWKASDATSIINRIAKNPLCEFSYTLHARDRMDERNLIVSDLLYVLRNGYVYDEPETSSIDGFYKYCVEGQSPNSGARYLRVIAVPDPNECQIKAITIMWRDGS